LIIDDYGGSADNSKVSATKTQVDELVNSGRLLPLGYYGFGTWVGRWQGIMLPRADDKMDNTIWRGDEEAIEILA